MEPKQRMGCYGSIPWKLSGNRAAPEILTDITSSTDLSVKRSHTILQRIGFAVLSVVMRQHVLNRNRLRRARARLDDLLRQIDPHHFFRLIWAVRGIQTDIEPGHLDQFSRLPAESVGAEMQSNFFAAPWLLETLVNEYLVVNHGRKIKPAPVATFKFEWALVADLINAINNLEESELLVRGYPDDFFHIFVPLKYRQFHWQSGIVVYPAFFRSHFLLNDDQILENFLGATGLSLEEFTKCGMCLWSQARTHPANYVTNSFEAVGVSNEVKRQFLTIVGSTWNAATEEAGKVRPADVEVAYKPSILRERPIILLDGAPTRVLVPLVELLVNRITGELYYDAIGDDDRSKTVYAERFEAYCFELISRSLTDLDWCREIEYGPKKRRQRTPDILGLSGDEAQLVIECKAKRVPFRLKSNVDEQDKLDDFLQELAKGQFQIWKFAQHVRTGIVPDIGSATNAYGLVVTYEDWSTALPRFRENIDRLAEEMAAAAGLDLLAEDKIPTCFASVESLEQLVASATSENLRSTIASYREGYEGWDLVNVWSRLHKAPEEPRAYPFAGEMGRALPWLGDLWT